MTEPSIWREYPDERHHEHDLTIDGVLVESEDFMPSKMTLSHIHQITEPGHTHEIIVGAAWRKVRQGI